MKLDATDYRYMSSDEFRVLTAVEMGSKNHEVVPSTLIAKIAALRSGGVNKSLGVLAKRNLISKVQNAKYDGYRLTYGGYDYLAMRALSKRDSMYSVGNQIGVGKESDIYVVADAEGKQMVLKLHRLGRVSFRAIKEKRDYMGKRKSASWMYMSRLAAQKEWDFMKVLHEHGFPVPTPIDHARHCIVMEYIDALPLRQIGDIRSPEKLYSKVMDLIVRLADFGLIHGDYNEFNILIHRKTGEPAMIDFPQMVSTTHENAEWYFNRDVECIRLFFRRRFGYESVLYPRFRSVMGECEKEEEPEYVDMEEGEGSARQRHRQRQRQCPGTVTVTCRNVTCQEEVEEEESDSDSNSNSNSNSNSRRHRRSLAPSPTDSLVALAASLSLSVISSSSADDSPRAVIANPDQQHQERFLSGITRHQKQKAQQSKYHSRRATRKVGRPKGSKAKQDARIKC